jgi:hypothetical protein
VIIVCRRGREREERMTRTRGEEEEETKVYRVDAPFSGWWQAGFNLRATGEREERGTRYSAPQQVFDQLHFII